MTRRRANSLKERNLAKLKNVHPGEVLLEEFLIPMNLSQNALARAVGVPPRRINETCSASARSPRIPRCASPKHSEPRKDSGLDSRRITISRKRAKSSQKSSHRSNG